MLIAAPLRQTILLIHEQLTTTAASKSPAVCHSIPSSFAGHLAACKRCANS